MIDPGHKRLSIVRQCALVSISRASFYRQPASESPENLELMRLIDEAFLECPFYGARQMARHLRRLGWCLGRKRVRRLMRKIGLSPIYQAPKTSAPHPQHKIYPYLLRHMTIERPNHVWCADVTYIPMRRGFLYLVAIMDWASRKVLAWRLSNTMEADFCVAALEDAIARYGRPDIFNTDQGSQFTSFAFTNTLRDAGIRISMDGRGRWMDNVFIERLWRIVEIRVCVPQRLRDGHRGPLRDWSLDQLLQCRTATLIVRRQDARRGLCYRTANGETGGVIKPRIHLSPAAKLSQKADPPLCHILAMEDDRLVRIASEEFRLKPVHFLEWQRPAPDYEVSRHRIYFKISVSLVGHDVSQIVVSNFIQHLESVSHRIQYEEPARKSKVPGKTFPQSSPRTTTQAYPKRISTGR